MKRNHIADRGQVLIIFVFAIVGLIGMTGLAIDGGNIFSDRRHAQNAADTAALAAALTKVNAQRAIYHHESGYGSYGDCTDVDSSPSVCGSKIINAALNMAKKNGYTNNIVDSTVEIHVPPTSGPYAVADGTFNPYDYVEVTIDTNVNTFFARVLGIPQLHNHVQAIARAQYAPPGGLYGGNTLVSLKPGGNDCSGDFDLGGSSKVVLIGGGVFVNSDNTCAAFKEESSCVTLELWYDSTHRMYPVYDVYGKIIPGKIYDINGNIVDGAGVIDSVPGAGSQTSSCAGAPALDTSNPQFQFPPDPPPLSRPEECTKAPVGNHTDGDGYDHLYPGHYASLPPAKNTRLDPGVYCIDNLIKVTNPSSHLGVASSVPDDGVLLYIKDGGAFDFQGGTINLRASGHTDDPYKGWLIFMEHDFSGWNIADPVPNCQINGNAASTFQGTIYAPYCDVVINGTSDNTGFMSQIIAYTIQLSGDTALKFTYNADDQGTTPEINLTGLSH